MCNESVHILRICGLDLYVYWEYTERICTYTENMRNRQKVKYFNEFETKIDNILGSLSGAWMGLLPNSRKTKWSDTSVPLRVTVVAQWAKAPGIHSYVVGSIPAVTPRYCTKKIEKNSLWSTKKKQRKKKPCLANSKRGQYSAQIIRADKLGGPPDITTRVA